MKLAEVVNGARRYGDLFEIGAFPYHCTEYLNPGASGLNYCDII